MADDLAAPLAEIEERARLAKAWGLLKPRVVAESALDVPRLLAALEAVLELHQRIPDQRGIADGPPRPPICSGCRIAWPCQEYEAITAALTGKGADR
jgi:hypothetical protein